MSVPAYQEASAFANTCAILANAIVGGDKAEVAKLCFFAALVAIHEMKHTNDDDPTCMIETLKMMHELTSQYEARLSEVGGAIH